MSASHLPEQLSRATLSETCAVSASGFLASRQMATLESMLRGILRRHDDLRSIGVRNAAGELEIQVGPHDSWLAEADSVTNGQLTVPLFQSDAAQWGTLEFHFAPIYSGGLLGLAQQMDAPLFCLIGCTSFLLINVVLFFVLKHLDPANAGVPRRVREALNQFAEGLMLVDHRGKILLANDAFAKPCGAEPDSLVGERVSAFEFFAPDSGKLPWNRVIETKSAVANERVQLIDASGKLLTFLVNCIPIGESKSQGMMVTLDDVTQLEESRVALSEARDEAAAANQAKSDFLANMSHEIRTPMNAILGFTDVLRRGLEESSNQRFDYLNTIHSSGSHLISLINDILDLSKIEAGKLELENHEFDLPQLIHETLAVNSARAEASGIGLRYEVLGDIPSILSSDSTRIRQILINLLGNAIKFTKEGEVVLRVAAQGSVLQFEVSDTGIGMTDQQQEKIFDAFGQADSSVTRRFGGTGLGLSICKRFAEALGGGITVTSELGAGSTFRVEISVDVPYKSVWMDKAEVEQHIFEAQAESDTEQLQRLKPGRVLLVEDGEANRQLVSFVLKKQGIEVSEADNGKIGIEIAREEHFDVILMDMQMPVLDGYSATKQLRDLGFETPIIALTGNAMQGDREKCIEAGCDDFLLKPFELNDLLQTVGSFLGFAACEANAVETTHHENDSGTSMLAPEPPIGEESPTPLLEDSEVVSLGDGCWTSSLANEGPEIQSILSDFVDDLSSKLELMELAIEAEDFDTLESLAHWLKGSGGSLGFDRFTAPATALESAAGASLLEDCRHQWRSLVALNASIDLSTSAPT